MMFEIVCVHKIRKRKGRERSGERFIARKRKERVKRQDMEREAERKKRERDNSE